MNWLVGSALITVFCALMQLFAASRRDLGPMTIGLVSAVLVIARPPGAEVAALLVIAALVAALAWARAAAHGVGRPALNGVALAVGMVAGLSPYWTLPMGWEETNIARVAVIPCLLIAAMGGILAAERPGPRPTRTRWYGRVPVGDGD
ncbi:MAG: hypothetical protein HN348_33860 [Proteobacteria bacterium]|jgi:hypothetical protein|nr:hypothetical protein [Pseudomonadota bacterium]